MAPVIPPEVQARVARHVGTLRAWNAAIAQARQMEAIAHQPGRYEYDLRCTAAGEAIRYQLGQALQALDALEIRARQHGVPSLDLYAAVGGKPALQPEGEAVSQWARDTTAATKSVKTTHLGTGRSSVG